MSQTGARGRPVSRKVSTGGDPRKEIHAVRETSEGKMEAFGARRRTGEFAESSWWVVAKNGTGGLEPLVVGGGEERALAVFGYEEEATMFFLLGGLEGDGWRVRQSGAGEIVSLLCGPCADIGSVALDPLPGKAADGTLGLVCVAREGFLERLLDGRSHRSRLAAHAKTGPTANRDLAGEREKR